MVPARLRIVGWILLATALGLMAVVITIRNSELARVAREANTEVAHEVAEFRVFVADSANTPVTDSPERVLELYVRQELPDENEVLLGYVSSAATNQGAPLILQSVSDHVGLTRDSSLVRALVESKQNSGIDVTGDGTPFRWGKATVVPAQGGSGGVFLVAVSTKSAEQAVASQVRLVALVCLGGLLLTAGIAWVAAGQVLAPVRQVRQAAARITRLHLDQRIAVRGRDDVAALALTFNAMLDRLEAALSAQRRFLGTAEAHLRVFAERLRTRLGADPEAADALGQVTTILDDLQILAASASPDFVELRSVDVGRFVDDVATRVRNRTGRRWRVVSRATGEATLDSERVAEALMRLARNAVQASPADGELRLGSRVLSDSFELWVGDEGNGLTADEIRACFDLSRQIPVPLHDRGPGLGLAVARVVADAHNGSVWAESTPGQGATFGLALPLRPRLDGAPADSPAESAPASTAHRDLDLELR